MIRYTAKMERSIVEAQREGYEQGYKEGLEAGIAKGRAEVYRAWYADWDRRWRAAIASGIPFTDPPPVDPDNPTAVAHEQGRKHGVAQGRVEVYFAWTDWNKRREEAEAKGEPFTDLPPPNPENGTGK
jgi:hypothetical protein